MFVWKDSKINMKIMPINTEHAQTDTSNHHASAITVLFTQQQKPPCSRPFCQSTHLGTPFSQTHTLKIPKFFHLSVGQRSIRFDGAHGETIPSACVFLLHLRAVSFLFPTSARIRSRCAHTKRRLTSNCNSNWSYPALMSNPTIGKSTFLTLTHTHHTHTQTFNYTSLYSLAGLMPSDPHWTPPTPPHPHPIHSSMKSLARSTLPSHPLPPPAPILVIFRSNTCTIQAHNNHHKHIPNTHTQYKNIYINITLTKYKPDRHIICIVRFLCTHIVITFSLFSLVCVTYIVSYRSFYRRHAHMMMTQTRWRQKKTVALLRSLHADTRTLPRIIWIRPLSRILVDNFNDAVFNIDPSSLLSRNLIKYKLHNLRDRALLASFTRVLDWTVSIHFGSRRQNKALRFPFGTCWRSFCNRKYAESPLLVPTYIPKT